MLALIHIKETFIKKEIFDQQESVYKYTIQNSNLSVSVLNYGGIIQEILYPNIHNVWENVVLGYDNFHSYQSNIPYFGCITGRSAGRIPDGIFQLEGQEYHLATNASSNHLHGGFSGLDKRLWHEEEFTNSRLVLSYYSPDKEENYPGNIKIFLTYQLKDNALEWYIKATTDQTTILNLTNHSYFNLSAGKSLGTKQLLQLDSDAFFELNTNMIPTEKLLSTQQNPFDFSSFKEIQQDLHTKDIQLQIAGGYDHCFLLNNSPILLRDKLSRRQLAIQSNQKACVFYSGNFLTNTMPPISHNQFCQQHLGICLETQAPPNSINMPKYRDLVILHPKDIYQHKNTWTFSIY
ncbi:MAG: aldose epimerase family protein [Brevinema sp.]